MRGSDKNVWNFSKIFSTVEDEPPRRVFYDSKITMSKHRIKEISTFIEKVRNMAGNITVTIIKPNAIAHEHIGDILKMISEAGFWIAAIKFVKLNRNQAACFYSIHKGKPFFEGLVKFMTSGPIVVAILERELAVETYRKLIGDTDPEKAEPGTIRKLFAESIRQNAVHGSDSDENARKEADFFFSTSERFDRKGNVLEL